jgi:NitT/TauT family transport system permease protein
VTARLARGLRETGITFLIAAALIGLWYLIAWRLKASGDLTAAEKLPYPHLILERIWDNPGTLADATWTTLGRALIGFAFGSGAGLAIAIVMVQARWVEAALMPYVLGAQMVPLVALVPIVRTMLHSDSATRIFMAAFITFFSVVVAQVRGLRSAPPEAIELMRSYNVGRFRLLRYLSLPASLPYLFSGLRIAAPLSLVGAIVVDLMGAQNGLGYLMLAAITFGPQQFPILWAAMVITLVLGFALSQVVQLVERMVTPWQVGLRREGEA